MEGVAGAVEEEDRVVEGARDAGADCYASRGITGGVVIGADGFHGRLIEIDQRCYRCGCDRFLFCQEKVL